MPNYTVPNLDSSKKEEPVMTENIIPSNSSEQRLMEFESNRSLPPPGGDTPARTQIHHKKLLVAVLCYVNLINYMDRYTVAGKLSLISS